jgi:Flp pilus assembly pilin Flp
MKQDLHQRHFARFGAAYGLIAALVAVAIMRG